MEPEQIVQLITAGLGSSVGTLLVKMWVDRYRHERKAETARSLHEEIRLAAKLEDGDASETELILARFVRADIEARLLTAVVPSDKVTRAFFLGGGFLSLVVGLGTLSITPSKASVVLFAITFVAWSGYVIEFKQVNGLRAILLSLMRTDSDPAIENLPRRYREWLKETDGRDFTFGPCTKAIIAPAIQNEVANLIKICRRVGDQQVCMRVPAQQVR